MFIISFRHKARWFKSLSFPQIQASPMTVRDARFL